MKGKKEQIVSGKYMQLQIPDDINFLLRRYALEMRLGNKEKATIYIIANFFKQYYKLGEKK